MAWYWWAAAVVGGAGLFLALRTFRAMSLEFQHERARELFRLQKERLEAKFMDAAAATGKPKGLTWVDCAFESNLELVREERTRELLGLIPVTIKFAAIEGGPMEGVEAVDNLRYATAVFSFQKGQWITQGRALFNMHPHEALEHFGGALHKVN